MFTGLAANGHVARGSTSSMPPPYTAPFGDRGQLVVTIHDVSYERHPEWYPYKRDPLRRAFYRRSARTADRIITDSAFSKPEIVEPTALGRDIGLTSSRWPPRPR